MNKFYVSAFMASVAGGLTVQDWLFILSICISVLGMVRDYVKMREDKK